ncbi:redoxin domain-containing protein [Planctomicrobium piriforme]|uniref:redoxin domain-containing protein n=1 Tax=Planctomicrobium piriforme TaxID=1576369 RepID=UPI00158763E7|nr:redoxin domain-containing protein [Planctomicrobium piriforme]
MIDLGTVTLKQGRIATLTVVNSLGNPQPGATVSSYSGIAGPAMNVTDKNGNCQLHIQSGEQTISGVFGRLFGFIAVPANEEDVRVELVLSRSLDDTGTGFETAGRGMPAPQLSVAEWTDGQRRQLADFKGKVVVLYFWNKDEEHCDEQIASIDRLQQRYAGQPVVFLGVHKAGVKAADVREYMLTQDWHLPTGVDVSSDEVDGSTFLAYETAPSYIAVIGKDGRLSFNFSAIASEEVGEAIFARAATELGYKWPIEESPGADEKAGCEPCTQIFERIESQAIDAALEQ